MRKKKSQYNNEKSKHILTGEIKAHGFLFYSTRVEQGEFLLSFEQKLSGSEQNYTETKYNDKVLYN